MEPRSGSRLVITHDIGVDVVAFVGRLDFTTAESLQTAAIDDADLTQPVLLVDLTGLEFIDARGLATLVAARRQAAARHVDFVVACERPQLLKLLRISRLSAVTKIVRSPAEVLVGDGAA